MRRLAALAFLLTTASFLASASVDQGLLALVPAGSKFIAGVDVDRAKSSELWQYAAAKAHTDDKDIADFVQVTGFDPRRDLQQIIIAGTPPQAGHPEAKGAVLARGNFDMERIRASAKKKGWALENADGVEMLVNRPSEMQGNGHMKDGPNAFAFLGDGIAVVGQMATVKQIVANRGGATALDASVQAKITKTAADNDIWFVSFVSGSDLAAHLNGSPANGGEAKPGANQGWPQAQALQSVQQASGGVQLGDLVRVTFDAVTRSPKDATSLADVVRFFASMVQMERQKDPRADMAADAFDKMELATDGDAVHVSLAFPEKSLEKLVDDGPVGVAAHPTPNKQ
jgi:hypothetical protein